MGSNLVYPLGLCRETTSRTRSTRCKEWTDGRHLAPDKRPCQSSQPRCLLASWQPLCKHFSQAELIRDRPLVRRSICCFDEVRGILEAPTWLTRKVRNEVAATRRAGSRQLQHVCDSAGLGEETISSQATCYASKGRKFATRCSADRSPISRSKCVARWVVQATRRARNKARAKAEVQ